LIEPRLTSLVCTVPRPPRATKKRKRKTRRRWNFKHNQPPTQKHRIYIFISRFFFPPFPLRSPCVAPFSFCPVKAMNKIRASSLPFFSAPIFSPHDTLRRMIPLQRLRQTDLPAISCFLPPKICCKFGSHWKVGPIQRLTLTGTILFAGLFGFLSSAE